MPRDDITAEVTVGKKNVFSLQILYLKKVRDRITQTIRETIQAT